jgi:hypothetical protein
MLRKSLCTLGILLASATMAQDGSEGDVVTEDAVDAVTDAVAPPPAGFQPTPPNELTLRYGDELGDGAAIDIREEISIDLIDLDPLRERLGGALNEEQFNLSLQECILIALSDNLDI